MNNGFVILGDDRTSLRNACACAYSIKSEMPTASVSLIVPDLEQDHSRYDEPFDNIIEMKFGRTSGDLRASEWQHWWNSPYDNTIAVSPTMLVKRDLSSVFDYCIDNHDICFPSHITNFKNEKLPIADPRYEFMERYELPVMYSDIFFFNKSDTALEYFKLADPYFQNEKDLIGKIISREHITGKFDANLLHSILVAHLDIGDDVTPIFDDMFYYIDMGISEFYFNKRYNSWLDYINVWPSENGKIKLQNYAVTECLAYESNEFLTKEIFDGQQANFKIRNK
jgi:hypothetical protein